MEKIVVNRCVGGFGLSQEAYEELGLKWDGHGYEYREEEKRVDPKLVEVVERLGEKANGNSADLRVIEIPDNVSWYIDNCLGYETVRERHRFW